VGGVDRDESSIYDINDKEENEDFRPVKRRMPPSESTIKHPTSRIKSPRDRIIVYACRDRQRRMSGSYHRGSRRIDRKDDKV